jgi:hypothetical protein
MSQNLILGLSICSESVVNNVYNLEVVALEAKVQPTTMIYNKDTTKLDTV